MTREVPDHAAAYYHLGALEEAASRDEAIAAYTRALELRPDYFDACAIGPSPALVGRNGEAVACFRQALALRRDWLPGLNSLCWLLATASDAEVRNGREAVQGAEGALSADRLSRFRGARHAGCRLRRTWRLSPGLGDPATCAIQLQAQQSRPGDLEPLRQRLAL